MPESSEGESKPWSQQQTPAAASGNTNNGHQRLREYETRRRLVYTSKFDSMSLYWKSYRDLLSASLSETARAQRLVLGTSHAHQQFAEALKALHQDVYLDEKGNIASEKLQKRLMATRQHAESNASNYASSVVHQVRASQKELSDRFGENAANIDEEIADAVGSLLEDVKAQFTTMEQLGSAILTELEKTEQEVSQAWNNYVSKSLATGNSSAGISPRSPQEMAPKNGEETDPWVVEMQYRVAAAYQNAAWEKGSVVLTELFDKVKDEECMRRMNLREFLVAFVQRQQRLLLSLPGIQDDALKDLVGKKMTLEEMQQYVQSIIDTNTSKYKKESTSEIQSEGGVLGESPLVSDLFSKAKVVERRGGGINNVWMTTLAVMTADSCLHLFDLESTGISPGDAPEVAFKVLVPNVVLPTPDNVALGKSNFTKGWSDSLTPSESLILGNCTIKTKDERTFELVETVITTGASKMFGKTGVKRIQIRAASPTEAEEWIALLTA